MTNRENIYSVSKQGRLSVKDNKAFLNLLAGTDTDTYEKLTIYAKKQLQKSATDIPIKDKDQIINFAIFKTFQDFDSEAGSNVLTYFTSKLRGEVSDYRNKRESMMNKVHALVNHERDAYKNVFNSDREENELEKVTEETPETILFAEDIYRRKIQAFRMAYSGIPFYSQYILNRIVELKETLDYIASEENMSVMELTKIRNHALSLILSRVLRSNHLDEDEKNEIKKEHGLDFNEV